MEKREKAKEESKSINNLEKGVNQKIKFDLNEFPEDETEVSSHQVVFMMWKIYFPKFLCCLGSNSN